MKKSVDSSIRYLKGIGPQRANLLSQAGIRTIEDLLYFFPRRYQDRSQIIPISKLRPRQVQAIKATVLARGEKRSWRRRGFNILKLAVADKTGKIFCVWFNQPYLKDYFKVGTELILYGRVDTYENQLQMSSPEFEIISAENKQGKEAKIVPIYRLPEKFTQRYLRRIIENLLKEYIPQINDFLPYDLRSRNGLLNLAKSLINIHFPQDPQTQKQAYQRLAFEEFFLFQLPLALRKLKKRERQGIAHKVQGDLVDEFIRGLAFELTESQKKVIQEIGLDMGRALSMQRLLQGDVGSGKTVVATVATLIAIQGGYQAAFLVPTEILANQHYKNIKSQFSDLKLQGRRLKIALLTSNINKKAKERIYKGILNGQFNLVIGTHALLEEEVKFKNLGLVVIDEQHKFGVGQRALLPKKGNNPDVLIMTATPIPRTLAITLYGDLDISVIRELPPGRKPINTEWITQEKRKWLYAFIKEALNSGRQAYVVYPIIEDSFQLDLLSATKMYQEFKDNFFKEYNVGLIHGRLKQAQQDRIMGDFKQGKIQILIATTVLEVGIDVANVTVMVIENAERFGLCQLHQLRGRIGRGGYESSCFLVSDTTSLDARRRLEAMVNYRDGFLIAEEDLKIRGPGEFFGSRQHGLTELKIANPLTQMQLLKRARDEAIKLIFTDPQLEGRQNLLLKEKLFQRFPGYERYISTG